MTALHDLFCRIFGLWLGPLDRILPNGGLWVTSVVSGIALLWIFRYASNPTAIRDARRAAQAELLAARLYREDPAVVLRAQARFLAALGRYLGHMMVPFVVLLLPFGLLAAELDARYATRALAVGARAVVEVSGVAPIESVSLEGGDGITIESGPVRIGERNEASWRILATAPGTHRLSVVSDGGRVEKVVVVSAVAEPASRRRARASVSSLFVAPAEPAIPASVGIRRVEIRYPALEIAIFGWKTSWLVVFLAVSAAIAFALRRRMGVEF